MEWEKILVQGSVCVGELGRGMNPPKASLSTTCKPPLLPDHCIPICP